MPNKKKPQDQFASSQFIHVWIGMWAGLITGIGEVAIFAVVKYLLHEIHIIHSPHFVWMSPLSNMLIFAGIGLFLVVLNSFKQGMISIRSSLALFILLWSVSLLSMLIYKDKWLILVFSLGPTILISRIIFINLQRFLVFMRKTLIIFPSMLFLIALTLFSHATILESQAIKELPPPVYAQAPNVLFIVLDTVRAQSLSLYGYDRDTTPRLSEFGTTGVRFNRALSTAPWTLPSHGSMFTGHHAHELSTNWRDPLEATYPTLAETLRKTGYLTAGFVANLEYCSYVYGINRGFIHYEDFEISLGELAISSALIRSIFTIPNERWFPYYELLNRKPAQKINHAFLDWLSETKKEGRPFFAFLNYFDAHEPYHPPDKYRQMFENNVDTLPFADLWKRYTPTEAERLQNLYEASIAFLDSQIGELLDTLRSDGMLENTIVIITSDHGEEFSEHGVPSHGHTLYGPSLHVPLIISFPPKIPQGAVVSNWVSLRDLPATITELINDSHPNTEKTFPGNSLTRYWTENDTPKTLGIPSTPILSELRYAMYLPEWHPVSKGDMKSMVAHDLHYIVRGDGKEEIYDLRRDPWETKDLSATPSGQDLATCLRNQLKANLNYASQRQKLEINAKNANQLAFPPGNLYPNCKELFVQKENF